MTDFTFTKLYEVTSSAVDQIYYNENDKTLVIDFNDRMYQYSDVPAEEVTKLVTADSVGSAANVFKQSFGPGRYLGVWDKVSMEHVSVAATGTGAPQDWTVTDSATGNATGPHTHFEVSESVEPTKEYSLADPKPANTSIVLGSIASGAILHGTPPKAYDFIVEFEVNGVARSHVVKAVTRVEDAVEAITSFASSLGVEVKVKRVVVELG